MQCYFQVDQSPEKPGWYNNLFFCSSSMRDNYFAYRDFIFVNRRLSSTRFSRSLILFCGVSSNGRSVLFGFAMITREDEKNYFFAVD